MDLKHLEKKLFSLSVWILFFFFFTFFHLLPKTDLNILLFIHYTQRRRFYLVLVFIPTLTDCMFIVILRLSYGSRGHTHTHTHIHPFIYVGIREMLFSAFLYFGWCWCCCWFGYSEIG